MEWCAEKRESGLGRFGAQIDDLGGGRIERSAGGGEEPFDGTGKAGGDFDGARGELEEDRVFACGEFAEISDGFELGVGVAEPIEHRFFRGFWDHLGVLAVAVEDFRWGG